MRVSRQYISPTQAMFVVGEGVLIFFSVALAAYFMMGRDGGFAETLEFNWGKIILVTLITQLTLYFNDLYEFRNTENGVELVSRLIQSIGITSIALALLYFLWPDLIIGRWIFFASILVLLLFVVSWRLLYALLIRKKLLAERAMVLGSGGLARNILKEISGRKDLGYDVRILMSHEDKPELPDAAAIPFHQGYEGICDLAEKERIGSIIVALDEKRGVLPYRELLNCKVRGINIVDGESFYERVAGKLLVEKLNPSWLIFSDGFVKSRLSRITKRLVGLILSTGMLILLSPLLLLVAVAIKLESRGPVIFAQERVGEFGEIFTIYKFRSMVSDAEKTTGPVWASEEDPRITRVGRIIRKLRIDELPQLWNVFKGDMSFVGPRPERPFFVESLRKKIPYYNERFSVKPGVTGWAQIKYPYGASEEDALEKLKYDLYYIKNMSLLMDLIVIFHTVKTVLLVRGSR